MVLMPFRVNSAYRRRPKISALLSLSLSIINAVAGAAVIIDFLYKKGTHFVFVISNRYC